jgi:hypothetical protein
MHIAEYECLLADMISKSGRVHIIYSGAARYYGRVGYESDSILRISKASLLWEDLIGHPRYSSLDRIFVK